MSKTIELLNQTYAQTGNSTTMNDMGMRECNRAPLPNAKANTCLLNPHLRRANLEP